MDKIQKNYKSIFADIGLLYASAIWGTTFFIVRDIVKYIDPITLCFYRFLLAALILAFFVILRGKSLFLNLKEGFILGIFLWLIYISQTIGLVYTTASNAAFITGLFVAFVPVFSLVITKTIPTFNRLIAVLIAIIGLWFLTGGLKGMNKGDLITLICAMTYALHVLFTDKYAKNGIDPYIACFQQFFFVALFSFFTMAVFKISLQSSATKTIWIILYLTLLPTVLAFLIQIIAQKITTPTKVALIFALEPVFGAVFAWTLGGESYNLSQIIGGLLIFIAILISELKINLNIPYLSLNKSLK